MTTRCGFIALIGRPNVGKSTLLNSLIGKKISITSRKPQTTQHQIRGILTQAETQFIFVDTPGLHNNQKGLLNHYLNLAAINSLRQVDVILWLVDATRWQSDDDYAAAKLRHVEIPVIMVLNKVDLLKNRDAVMPLIADYTKQWPNITVIPISAKNRYQLPRLLQLIDQQLPEAPFYFDEQQCTDKTENFLAAELVREAVIDGLGQELPYTTQIAIENFVRQKNILRIQAIIWVARIGQKAIVIGDQGQRLKMIATRARLALEKHFQQKVFLQVWVKLKKNWIEDARLMKTLYQSE